MISLSKINSLPSKPGVYIFKDKKSKIIYIGKALSLKHRVKSYFAKKLTDPKTAVMVPQIASIENLMVDSEFEALLLEAKLIKEHLPKYNLELKDDKSYLYIAISKEPFPRIFVVRRPELENKLLDWYGPFPSSGQTREILRYLRRIFPFRSCNRLPRKPCLYFDLKLCPGVCDFPDFPYQKNVSGLRKMFNGQTNQIVKSLEKEMKLAAKNLDFEEAQKVKYKLTALSYLKQGWKTVPKEKAATKKAEKEIKKILVKYGGVNIYALNKIEGFDVSNLGRQIIVGAMVTFVNGSPEKGLYRIFKIKLTSGLTDDPQSIGQIIDRRLNHPEWLYPQLILVDGGKPQVSAASASIGKHNLIGKIAILGLAKKEEIIVIPKTINNKIKSFKTLKLSPASPALRLLQSVRDESHRFAQKYYKNLHWKKTKK